MGAADLPTPRTNLTACQSSHLSNLTCLLRTHGWAGQTTPKIEGTAVNGYSQFSYEGLIPAWGYPPPSAASSESSDGRRRLRLEWPSSWRVEGVGCGCFAKRSEAAGV